MTKPNPLVLALAALGFSSVHAPASAENPCVACHEEQVAAVAKTAHQRAVRADAGFCAACHGDPAKHLETGEKADIRGRDALGRWQAQDQTQACLSCHRSSLPSFAASPHAQGQVSCWSCHPGVWHGPTPSASEPCATCHRPEAAAFRRAYHHPVPESKMRCASCHDPHREQPAEELQRERCLQCHRHAGGPFVFPHLAAEEGCVACHAPHGSTNRTLLVAAGNGLCVRCHTQSNFPAMGKVPHNFNLAGGARCFDCHSEPHGSNSSPLLAPRLWQ